MSLRSSPTFRKLRRLIQQIQGQPDLPKPPQPVHRYAHRFPDPAQFPDPAKFMDPSLNAPKAAGSRRSAR